MTLNNNKQDRSLASQFLTYKLFRKAGLAAPRCSFAAVTVNGKYLGVYSNVESIRKPFLRREFGDESGKLYEGTLTDFYPKSIEWFEAKTKDKRNDRSQLMQLATVLDDEPTLEEIAQFVDINYFLRYWAMESLIHFWDGYTQNQNNFFVYENPQNGLLHFMPWGADSCFGERPRFARWGEDASAAVRARSILANRLYHIDGVPEQYRQVMLELLADVWEEQDLCDELARIEALLFDDLDFSQIESLLEMDELRSFIEGRRGKIMAELNDDTWPVTVEEEPRKPMYVVEIGSAAGTFSTSSSANDQSPVANVDASLTLDGQTINFDSATVQGCEAILNGSITTATIELSGVQDGEPIDLTLTTVEADDSKEKTWTVIGSLYPWSRALRNRQISGAMTVLDYDHETGVFVGEFEVKLLEKRGGFMNRRRR